MTLMVGNANNDKVPPKRDPTAVTIGQNIKARRKQLGLSREDLGAQVLKGKNLNPENAAMRIRQWENADKKPNSKNLRLIAGELGLKVEDLFRSSQRLRYHGANPGEPIPVISWGEIQHMNQHHEPVPVLGYIQPYMLEDKDAFGAIILDDSMTPTFHPGNVIVISPGTRAQTGDYVVFLLDNEPILRVAHFYFSETLLKPLNPDYEEIIIKHVDTDHALSIVGTVVQIIHRLK